ncbi:MAG TPA: hypothetical protein VGF73_04970 [Chthoniobacterales bacterium]|jgi:hypothetical protein
MKKILPGLLLCTASIYARAANPGAADTASAERQAYTVNDSQPRAEAIAIKGDRIVSSTRTARQKNSNAVTHTIDVKGSRSCRD